MSYNLSDLKKEEQIRGIAIFHIKPQTTLIKTAWYWHKNRHIDQWNRIESPEINLCLYGQFIFDKGGRSINGAKTASSADGLGRSGQLCAKKMKLDHQLTPYTKINSRWIKDLSISCNTINVLEENIGRKISRHSTQQHPHRHIP